MIKLTLQKSEWVKIGRDLIRLMQIVSPLKEFKPIWDMLMAPAADSENKLLIEKVGSLPTPPEYLQSRLTTDMESKLLFLMKEVQNGRQRTYQVWFYSKFLVSSDYVIPDIVRYICCCFRAPEASAATVVPRWAMLGWLLKSARVS